MNVEQCMTKSPSTCMPGDTLATVARTLWEQDLGALPVVDAQGALLGMITDRDMCMAAYTSGLPLHACSVGRHMARAVTSIGPKAELSKAAELMRTMQVRRLPVVEGAKLVGMITLADLARSSGKNGKLRGLGAEEVARVLAGVCTARTRPATEAPAAPLPKKRKVKSVLASKPRPLARRK